MSLPEMKRLLTMAVALLLAGCSQPIAKKVEPCTTQDYSPAEIFQNAAPSIVVIKSGDSLGSGFVVKQDKRYTYILTNSHVVNRADAVLIKWSDDREEKGKVISDHGGEPLQKDLALVRVDAIRGEPLLLKEQPPAIGEDVVVIGAPQGLEFSLSRGVMSQLRNKGDFLQVDAAVNPGNSGGPLFDKTGCVVGVVTFKSQKSEGLNFAIAHGPTKHFLDNPAIERPQQKPAKVERKKRTGWFGYYEMTYYKNGNKTRASFGDLLLESISISGPWVNFKTRSYTVFAPHENNSFNDWAREYTTEQKDDIQKTGADCRQQIIRWYPHRDIGLEDYKLVGDEWWSQGDLRRGHRKGPPLTHHKEWSAMFDAACTIAASGDPGSFNPVTLTKQENPPATNRAPQTSSVDKNKPSGLPILYPMGGPYDD